MSESYEYLSQVYDALMYDADYDSWADYIGGLLEKYKGGGIRVIDAACGTGNISLRLKRMGFDIYASDISGEMLGVASEKARKAGLKLTFCLQDMRSLSFPPADAVTACCDAVNYLVGEDDARSFFRSAYNALKPGGLLLFDVSSMHKLRDILGDELFYEDGDDITYLWQNSFDESTKRVTMDVTLFIRDGGVYKRYDETHLQRAYTAQEITSLLSECGFNNIRAYSFLSEAPCTDDDERIQFAAIKGG